MTASIVLEGVVDFLKRLFAVSLAQEISSGKEDFSIVLESDRDFVELLITLSFINSFTSVTRASNVSGCSSFLIASLIRFFKFAQSSAVFYLSTGSSTFTNLSLSPLLPTSFLRQNIIIAMTPMTPRAPSTHQSQVRLLSSS